MDILFVIDDLPPPPPPIDMNSGLADYVPCTVNTILPPPPEELLPPPSPVSSSYSELRRATQPGQGFHDYSMGSQVIMHIYVYITFMFLICQNNYVIFNVFNKLYNVS